MPSTTPAPARASKLDARRVAARAGERLADEVVEPDVLALAPRLVAARELDQVGDEHPELGRLLLDVVQQPRALVRRQRLGLGQHLDVGAQAGDRRAQLVRGVGDELALGGDRALERVEHRVEVLGQLADLVVGLDLDPAAEVLGGGDVARRLGHVRDRRDDVARDEPAERTASAMPPRRRAQDQPQPREHGVGGFERAAELDAPRRCRESARS